MKKYSLSVYVLMMAICSFCGWLVENIWLLFTKGFIDNRSMHYPFLLGYGLFIMTVYFVLGTPSTIHIKIKKSRLKDSSTRFLTYLIIMMFVIGVGEIFMGYTVEHFCHFEYWNYTAVPLHLTKYTSLPTSLGFALIATVVMEKLIIPIMNLLSTIPLGIRNTLAIILLTIMVGDFLYSFYRMYTDQGLYIRWRIYIFS